MNHDEIFEPFEKLLPIIIEGRVEHVPENNSLLRCFQFLDVEGISDAELCWNGECLDCQIWIKNGETERAVIACRTLVREDIEITRISESINYTPPTG